MGAVIDLKAPYAESVEIRDSQDQTLREPHGYAPVYTPAPAWPSEPQLLQRSDTQRLLVLVFDIALIALPVLMVLKVWLVIACHYMEEDHRNSELDLVSGLTIFIIGINEQMVTAFTIVFVTIISTSVRRYALYKAQEGAYVSELEQLQGSISVPSTIRLIWSFRAWTKTSAALCLVWAFYYLGSQASKREFSLADSGPSKYLQALNWNFTAPIDFSDTLFDPRSGATVMELADKQFRNIMWNWYQLGGSTKSTRGSNFGPLIPDIQFALHPDAGVTESGPITTDLEGSSPDRHGWLDVSSQPRNRYMTLQGRILVIDTNTGDVSNNTWANYLANPVIGSYVAKTAYFQVACAAPERMAFEDFPNGTLADSSISFNETSSRTASTPRHAGQSIVRV